MRRLPAQHYGSVTGKIIFRNIFRAVESTTWTHALTKCATRSGRSFTPHCTPTRIPQRTATYASHRLIRCARCKQRRAGGVTLRSSKKDPNAARRILLVAAEASQPSCASTPSPLHCGIGAKLDVSEPNVGAGLEILTMLVKSHSPRPTPVGMRSTQLW